MNPYTENEGYTYKEITKATEIMKYCNGTHTEKEITSFMKEIIKDMTDKEKDNVYKIIHKEYKTIEQLFYRRP